MGEAEGVEGGGGGEGVEGEEEGAGAGRSGLLHLEREAVRCEEVRR